MGESAKIKVLDLRKYILMSNADLHPEICFCGFGSIWDAFWEPLGLFFGPKMLQTNMFFLSAFCMLSGSRAEGTQAKGRRAGVR